jgi:hypothetical protein
VFKTLPSEGQKCKLIHYFNREGREGDRDVKDKKKMRRGER